MSHISKTVYCAKCDLYFSDVDARSAHVDSSSTHPICGTCCRRFLNDNALSVHLKCAQPHLALSQESDGEEEILDGAEVLMSLTSELVPYFSIPEDEDYWSSESDAGSSDSGTELETDNEMEQNHDCVISLAANETGPEHQGLIGENFVDSSEIRVACHCPIIDKSDVIANFPEEGIQERAAW